MASLDTETTGLDFRHGARPFYVTLCTDPEQPPQFYEWAVDPFTRMPEIPDEDLEEIRELVLRSPLDGGCVLHNAKFDVTALNSVIPDLGERWPWETTHDTLYMAHLLASNQPKNLTALAVQYLGIDIEPFEVAIDRAVTEARRMCRRKDFIAKHGEWRIAKQGLPEMPSAKEKCGKYDMWLPKAVAKAEGYPEDHPWWTVLQEYANPDSAVTSALFAEMRSIVERRGLTAIYETRRKLLPVIYDMERAGVTVSRKRLEELRDRYERESEDAGDRCVKIAQTFEYDLRLPKSGNNRSLLEFCFGREEFDDEGLCPPDYSLGISKWIDLPVVGTTDTGNPSLDKAAMETYLHTLPPGPQLDFVTHLVGMRSRDTGVNYLEGYQRFWVETGEEGWYYLFPSLNATGTDTLRMSSQNPNAQNISKKENFNLRYAFGPAPGREWWCMDAQNIELRIPAYKSGEQEMIELFEHPNDPPYYGSNHLLNFSTVYGDLWEKESREVGSDKVGPHCKKKYAATWYQWCKNGGFAKQYGAQKEKTDATFRRPGAYDLIESRFRKLAALNAKCVNLANKTGGVETVPDKTVDPNGGYPLLCTRTEWGKIKPTVPLNYHVQGTAMWWMCKAMLRTSEYLNAEFPTARIVLQVHDELVFDFPQGIAGPTRNRNLRHVRELRRLMELGGDDIGVPTPVNVEYCPVTWADTRAVDLGV